MTCTLKILTHAPSDFHVLGDYPFSVGAACYGVDCKVTFVVHKNGNIVARGQPTLSTDRSLRVPSDSYSFRFRGIVPGTYTVQASATSGSGSFVTDQISLRVFQPAGQTIIVSNQSQFTAALNVVKTSTLDHVKIILNSGSYEFDASFDIFNGLLSVEASRGSNVVMRSAFGSSYPVKWAYFYGISFLSDSSSCMAVSSTGRFLLERCQFSGSQVGIVCDAGSGVRLEECHFANLTDGVINAHVLRSSTWENIAGTVVSNCSVIDGLFGSRVLPVANQSVADATLRVARFSSPVKGLLFRSVSSVSDYGALLDLSSSSCSNCAIVGNTMSSSSTKSLLTISSISNAVISDNSIRATGEPDVASSLSISGSVSDVIATNNWFSKIDRSANKLPKDSSYSNFVGSTPVDSIPASFTVASNPFGNNYLFPSEASPLRFSSSSVDIGVRTIQGMLKEAQVGALPYRSTQDAPAAYQAMRVNPDFSYVGPEIESI